MKKLLLVRHAEAYSEYCGGPDKDRSITIGGMQEIESIKSKMANNFSDISVVFCSNAKRARQTLEGIKSSLPTNIEIFYDDDLYASDADTVMKKLRKISDKHEGVLVIAHNPALSEILININIYNNIKLPKVMPTCGIVIGESVANKWSEIDQNNIKITNFLDP
jgi:phosphohistidine phosphatase